MKSKIDYKEIIKIIDLLEERNLSHFELEIEGFKIKISKNQPLSPASKLEPASSVSIEPGNSAVPLDEESEKTQNQDNLHYITSPMVGTFYRAPDPSSAPFIDEGDSIKKNQTLCIIEAMKLMNEIESDIDGVLEKAYVDNGKSVEYGQKLFAIKPL